MSDYPDSAPTPIMGAKVQGCKGTWNPFKTIHITEKETAQNVGLNIRIVPGWEVCDPEHQSDKNF